MKYKTSQEMYNELMNGNNEEIKNQWKKALGEERKFLEEKRKINFISLSICAVLDFFILYILFTKISMIFPMSNFFKIYLIVPILIIDAMVFIIMPFIVPSFGEEERKYNGIFKEKVIKGIMDNFYNSLEYFPNKQMPERIYDEPNYENYDNYYSDDYLEAKLDNKYNIAMAEVETEKEEEYTDSDGNKKTKTIALFHGLFAKVEMEKSINCQLDIELNSSLKILTTDKLEMDSRRI